MWVSCVSLVSQPIAILFAACISHVSQANYNACCMCFSLSQANYTACCMYFSCFSG